MLHDAHDETDDGLASLPTETEPSGGKKLMHD
jgi:hypothetical protein